MDKKLGAVLVLFATFLLLFGCPQDPQGWSQNGTGLPEPPAVPSLPNFSKIPPGQPSSPTSNATVPPKPPASQVPKAQNASVLPQPPRAAPVLLVNVSGYPTANANQRLIREVVGSFDEANENTFDNVGRISRLGPAAISDVLPLLEEENVYSQWAALEVLSATLPKANAEQKGNAKEALLPLLESKTASTRVLAAYLLLYYGDKNAIPVLIDSLDETERLVASEPPAPVCIIANEGLERYTGKEFGFSCGFGTQDAAGAKKWKDWWNASKDKLSYDAENRRFVEG